MIRRPPISTLDRSSAASDVYKRQVQGGDYRQPLGFDPAREAVAVGQTFGQHSSVGVDSGGGVVGVVDEGVNTGDVHGSTLVRRTGVCNRKLEESPEKL